MGIDTFNNVSGFANFILALNYESSGFLITGMLFVFFIIIVISMLKVAGSDLFETCAVSGFATFIPTLLATTLYFNSVKAVQFWVALFFGLIMVIGITGMYFRPKE